MAPGLVIHQREEQDLSCILLPGGRGALAAVSQPWERLINACAALLASFAVNRRRPAKGIYTANTEILIVCAPPPQLCFLGWSFAYCTLGRVTHCL